MKFNERPRDQAACKFTRKSSARFFKVQVAPEAYLRNASSLYEAQRDRLSVSRRRARRDYFVVPQDARDCCHPRRLLMTHYFSLFRVMIIVLKERQRFVTRTWIKRAVSPLLSSFMRIPFQLTTMDRDFVKYIARETINVQLSADMAREIASHARREWSSLRLFSGLEINTDDGTVKNGLFAILESVSKVEFFLRLVKRKARYCSFPTWRVKPCISIGEYGP